MSTLGGADQRTPCPTGANEIAKGVIFATANSHSWESLFALGRLSRACRWVLPALRDPQGIITLAFASRH